MPRTTSTSAMTGTGLKKCMPITCAGRLVSAAIFVIEMEEVFVARIADGGRIRSRAVKTWAFSSRRSGAASTASSMPASDSMSTVVVMRSRAGSTSASASLPLAASRLRLVRIESRARSRKRCSTSQSVTGKPERANTWAMPDPIVPAPITATFWISAIRKPPEQEGV